MSQWGRGGMQNDERGRGRGFGGRGGMGGDRGWQPSNTIFIGNIASEGLSEGFVTEQFGRYGKVLDVEFLQHSGHAYVHFETVEEGMAAHAGATQEGFCGNCKIGYGKHFNYSPEELQQYARGERPARGRGGFDGPRPPRGEDPPSNIVFIGDIPPQLSEQEVGECFGAFGNVSSAAVIASKGIGFVHLGSVEEATHAIETLKCTGINGHHVRLSFGKPRPAGNGRGRGGDRRY
uniref:RRM domain-containing protein n=1 Tax=Neobodo designis TaxID=312471 RepID=A0A7S1MC41_NEODS|mmetsp:Transcript_3791/g.12008  ORF Transcript_3791/g.12008 Transcript_3791/m.12008 type:complete len:234 (+) Transcript_3791:70-771(+)